MRAHPAASRTNTAELIPTGALVSFLGISFGLAWGIIALFIAWPDQMVALFGEITGDHPLFYLAVYAPAIAAFLLVLRHAGRAGLRRFLGRAMLWRCPLSWYAFLLLGIPLVFYLGAALQGNGLAGQGKEFATVPALLAALALAAIKGPVEEFGWRGFALPILQRKLAPAWCGLALGLAWGLWHFPAFLLSGTPQGAWSFAPFLLGTVAASVIMTALYNRSQGSILLAGLCHFQLMNPVWPDAQPYDMYLFVVVACGVLWIDRERMFSRSGALTQVVPARADAC